jgi:hypothetical protein
MATAGMTHPTAGYPRDVNSSKNRVEAVAEKVTGTTWTAIAQGCQQQQDVNNSRDTRNSSDASNILTAEMSTIADALYFRGYSLKIVKWKNSLEITRKQGKVYLLNISLQAIKISEV